MSDKPAEKKKDEHGEAGKEGAKAKAGIMGLLTKLPVLLGGAMVIEAVVLVVVLKALGGGPKAAAAVELPPVPAAAAEGEKPAGEAKAGEHAAAKPEGGEHAAAKEGEAPAPDDSADPKKSAELQLVEFRAPNKLSGRTYLYDVSIWVSVKGDKKAAVAGLIKDNEALIKDRVRTIIAQADPEKLGGGSEPGLETLRRQVKYQLDGIIGEKMVDEVLVPRCIPFRTDF